MSNEIDSKEFIAEYDAARILFVTKLQTKLSTRGAKRVLSALIQYPLNESNPVFPNKEEAELYAIGTQMQKMKNYIIAESLGVKFNRKGAVHGKENVSERGKHPQEQEQPEGELRQD